MAHILVVEDEENLRFALRRALGRSGHEVSDAASLEAARKLIRANEFDLILTDVLLGSGSGLDLVRELRAEGFPGAIVVMTAFGTVESAVAAMKDGADDYLQKPVSLEELAIQTGRWLEHRRLARRVELLERLEGVRDQPPQALGESPAWRRTVDLARRFAAVPIAPTRDSGLPSILLVGETGSGKGVLARLIHDAAGPAEAGRPSRGEQPPFVHVNCSALPPTLVEAELFGHERGAFTDAREARPGLFEMAHGGTIFLDEISETPPELQTKLLLVVEQGIFRRVGGGRERRVHARVIAATNQDLSAAVQRGAFRNDLYYRLNTFTIHVPPLREREDDAVLIADATLPRLCRQLGRPRRELDAAARQAIREHNWLGNVRELLNLLQRAVMLSDVERIGPRELGIAEPAAPATPYPRRSAEKTDQQPNIEGELAFDFERGPHTLEAVERELMLQALAHTRGNVSRAARVIGMQRSSFRYRIERYGLENFVAEASRR